MDARRARAVSARFCACTFVFINETFNLQVVFLSAGREPSTLPVSRRFHVHGVTHPTETTHRHRSWVQRNYIIITIRMSFPFVRYFSICLYEKKKIVPRTVGFVYVFVRPSRPTIIDEYRSGRKPRAPVPVHRHWALHISRISRLATDSTARPWPITKLLLTPRIKKKKKKLFVFAFFSRCTINRVISLWRLATVSSNRRSLVLRIRRCFTSNRFKRTVPVRRRPLSWTVWRQSVRTVRGGRTHTRKTITIRSGHESPKTFTNTISLCTRVWRY